MVMFIIVNMYNKSFCLGSSIEDEFLIYLLGTLLSQTTYDYYVYFGPRDPKYTVVQLQRSKKYKFVYKIQS